MPFTIPDMLNTPLSDTYFFITGYNVFVVLVTAVAAGALFALLRFTRIGIRIRAGMTDLETVSALGVNIYGMRALNFGLGLLLAGLAGVMAAGRLGLDPTMGQGLILPAFVAIIVGGLGSLPGAILGGLLIGVAAGRHLDLLPGGQRRGDLPDHGGRADRDAARAARRGRDRRMSELPSCPRARAARGAGAAARARCCSATRQPDRLGAAADRAGVAAAGRQLRRSSDRRSWCSRSPRWR